MSARLPIDAAEVAARYLAGESSIAIAADLGCSEIVIRLRLQERGVTLRPSNTKEYMARRPREVIAASAKKMTEGRRRKATGKRQIRVSVMMERELIAEIDSVLSECGEHRQQFIREAIRRRLRGIRQRQ